MKATDIVDLLKTLYDSQVISDSVVQCIKYRNLASITGSITSCVILSATLMSYVFVLLGNFLYNKQKN